ncbi:MAG: radical SAM family heme chaperone HemW [Gemmatimonadaceae bacterium]
MTKTASHVYIHVPFCARRCTYCDFAIAVRREAPVRQYLELLDTELRIRAASADHVVDTIYLGGGTPSLLGAAGLADLLGRIRERFETAPNAEVTVEANPEDVNDASVSAWQRAGITRVSLGVQSFEPRVLTWMHRVHDVEGARRAAAAVAGAGFHSWSLDLIFALPDELSRDWRRDLDEALALDPRHISVYGLTVEPHTPLARWIERGVTADAPEESYEREFLEAHARLTAAGLEHYEVSNYAREGHSSRHNSAYWREVPYIGFGPSAHSFDGRRRRWNTREYQAWATQVAAGTDPVAGSEVLSDDQRSLEHVYLGLRTSVGLRVDEVQPEIVEKWRDHGWAKLARERVRLTPQGWLRLDALVGALTVPSNPC